MTARVPASLLVVGVGELAYANTLNNGFTFDDPPVILNNLNLRDFSLKEEIQNP